MKKVSRREAMASLAAGGAGLALTNLTGAATAEANEGGGPPGHTGRGRGCRQGSRPAPARGSRGSGGSLAGAR